MNAVKGKEEINDNEQDGSDFYPQPCQPAGPGMSVCLGRNASNLVFAQLALLPVDVLGFFPQLSKQRFRRQEKRESLG